MKEAIFSNLCGYFQILSWTLLRETSLKVQSAEMKTK
jgi:hypothetical protein